MTKKLIRYEPIAMILIMWAIYTISLITTYSFLGLGIIPRSISGLLGFFTAPFIHLSFYHLLSNSIPFIILGLLVRTAGAVIFWKVSLIIMLVGGFIPWLLSSAGVIVGASGLVFGYWAYLLFNGIYTRSAKAIIIAVVVFIVYGTLAFSLFRFYPGVSFTGHLGGALGGFVAAFLLRKNNKAVEEE